MKVKFIVKSWGDNPSDVLERAKKYFPKEQLIEDSIIIRQISDDWEGWQVEGEYNAE